MKTIYRILITAVLVIIISHFMKGSITLQNGIQTSIIVAIVLGLLNAIVKPVLVFFTFPITVLSLGLFLLVINAAIILLCSHFVTGFKVDGFVTALIFSVILSVSQSIMYSITDNKK
jgi:putative membrane protein